MNTSDVVSRAFSLSSLENSQLISYADITNSLNEAWKSSIYATLTKSDDDYYNREYIVTITLAMAGSGQWEALVPLPADFFKVRYVDYMGFNSYQRMKRFNMGEKDYNTSQPMYRLQNNNLWVIGGSFTTWTGQIRIGYYPNPAVLTVPDIPVQYGSSLAPSAIPTLVSPWLVYIQTPSSPAQKTTQYTDYMLYVSGAGGKTIFVESYVNRTISAPVTLYTGAAAVTNVVYYKGTLYFLMSASIYSGTTNLSSTLTPAAIIGPAAVLSFTIINDTIYYSTATATHSCTLTGGSDVSLFAFKTLAVGIVGSTLVYVTTSGALVANTGTPTTIIAAGVADITTDGTNIYVQTSANVLSQVVVTSAFAITSQTTLSASALLLGNYANGMLATIAWTENVIQALSANPDTALSYPLNAVYEIMAYQMAIDFRRKSQGVSEPDQKSGALAQRLWGPNGNAVEPDAGSLWWEFREYVKRDEYANERIKNEYDSVMGYYR